MSTNRKNSKFFGRTSNKSNTIKKPTKSNTKSKKNSTQQEKPASSNCNNGKNNTESNKSSSNILESQKRQGCFSHNRSKDARMRKGQTQNKRQGGVGPRRVRERSVFPWKFGGIPAKFVSIGCKKLSLTFWKVEHCQGGRRVRRSTAQKQQHAQAEAKTAATASSRIRNSTNSTNKNPESVTAKTCGSRGCVFPCNFVRLCSRLFFLDTSQNSQSLVVDFFGSLMVGANQL